MSSQLSLQEPLYLNRTADRFVRDRQNQEARRQRVDELVFFTTELDDLRATKLGSAVDRELAMIRQALQELPPDCRTAFAMVKLNGLRIEDAADKLGVPPRLVRRHVARALAHCLMKLETGSAPGGPQ